MFRQFPPLILLAALLSASTCERPADVVIDGPDPTLVVVSNFTDQQVLQVQVSKSINALQGGRIEYVEDANIQLFEEEHFIERLILLDDRRTPFYTTVELKPKVGVKYTIEVDVPGFKTVRAKSSIPPQIQISKLTVSDLQVRTRGNNELLYDYRIELAFADPGRAKNFYHLKFSQQVLEYNLFQDDTVIVARHPREVVFSSADDNNSQLAYFNGGVLFEDGIYDGQTISYSFALTSSIRSEKELIGKVIAELRAVSEEYYLYHSSLNRQRENPGIPFTEPVIIYDNIENGQGIFAGYSSSVDSLALLH